ncbi:MAG TPA: Flp family type IVb pilin [Patescibacteria group bacterium]|nr:Flp family type IVb pilin [Patescibacteria group bacterium]
MKRSFLRNEEGATAIEYALIAGGVALAVAATVFVLGSKLNSFFSALSDAL